MPLVADYSLAWDIKHNSGRLFLRGDDGGKGEYALDSFEEFRAVHLILTSANRVAFDPKDTKLVMNWTAPGE